MSDGGEAVESQVLGEPQQPRSRQPVSGFIGGEGAFAAGAGHSDFVVSRPVSV